MSSNWVLSFAIVGLAIVPTGSVYAQERTRGHSGYTDSVSEERSDRVVEVIVSPEAPTPKARLSERIFDSQVSNEIKRRYNDSFGYTEIEQNINAPNRYSETLYSTGVRLTPEEDVEAKRKFGVYMMKKLTEHHVDHFIKESPTARPIYEAKERISNVKVQVKDGYQLKMNYSISGNQMRFEMKNPYKVINSIALQMDEQTIVPGDPKEVTLNLGYPLTASVNVNTYYKLEQGIWYLVGTRQVTPKLSTSISGSTYLNPKPNVVQPTLVLVGFTYIP